MIRTLNSSLSDAEICRRNGWRPGTILVGKEDGKESTIKITAVGEDEILATELSRTGKFEHESMQSLTERNWKSKS